MPNSHSMMDDIQASYIRAVAPATILDVGVGSGKTATLAKQAAPNAKLHGIEVHKPYFAQFAAAYKAYEKVECADFREWAKTNVDWRKDLTIFGDVLEHFGWSQVMDTLHFTLYRSRFVIAVWPERCPQGSSHDNLLEAHVCTISLADMARFNVIRYAKREVKGYWKHAILLKGMI